MIVPAHPPFPTAWNLLFQPLTGNHTSTLISESLVGLMVTATRQKSGRSLYGLPPLPPPPEGTNCPAGTTRAIVTVVSVNASFSRLSHVDPKAGTAHSNVRTHKVHSVVGIFIGASKWSEYTCMRSTMAILSKAST